MFSSVLTLKSPNPEPQALGLLQCVPLPPSAVEAESGLSSNGRGGVLHGFRRGDVS